MPHNGPMLILMSSFSDDYCDLVQEGIDVAVRIGGNDDSRLGA